MPTMIHLNSDHLNAFYSINANSMPHLQSIPFLLRPSIALAPIAVCIMLSTFSCIFTKNLLVAHGTRSEVMT
jgi:hypothetical protein